MNSMLRLLAGIALSFALIAIAFADDSPGKSFTWTEGDGTLTLKQGDTEWFTYQYLPKTFEQVPNNDPRRSRACFIHPLRGLEGEILTDSAPDDHFHHHGIFWVWPHVMIDGENHDMWNVPDIFQRHERWITRESGTEEAVLTVQNGWYLHDTIKVMTERLQITAYSQEGEERNFDLSLTLIPGDKPVTLRGAGGKSYGGVTLRMNVWPRKDAVVTSPQGMRKHVGGGMRSQEDLSNMPLKWAALTTSIPGGPRRSGVAILVPPSHPDYPPTWLTRCYGALCVGWPGVEEQTLQPGKPVTLSYRVRIHQGEPSVAEMEQVYQQYLKSLEE